MYCILGSFVLLLYKMKEPIFLPSMIYTISETYLFIEIRLSILPYYFNKYHLPLLPNAPFPLCEGIVFNSSYVYSSTSVIGTGTTKA